MKSLIYRNVNKSEEPHYQRYFIEALNCIDLQNFTDQTLGRTCHKSRIKSDYKQVEKIFNNAKKEYNLSPVVLQIMLEQYIWADTFLREIDKNIWVKRVMNRRKEDYFPDPMSVYQNVFGNKTNKWKRW